MSIFAPKDVVPAKTIEQFITFALRGVVCPRLSDAFSEIMHSSRAEKLLSKGAGLDEYLREQLNRQAAKIAEYALVRSNPQNNKAAYFVGIAENYRRLMNNLYDMDSLLGVADDNVPLGDDAEDARPSRRMCCLIIGCALKGRTKKVVLDVHAQDKCPPNPFLDTDTLKGSVMYLRGRKWYDMEAPPARLFPEMIMRIKLHAGLAPARVERIVPSTISFGREKKVYQLDVEVAPPNPPKKPYEKITITLP
jgi:hypothetical protein